MGNKQSKGTQEDAAISGVLQVVDDDEDAPPLELGLLEISEDDLTPQQMEMLHQKAAETGGNITAEDALDIAAKSEPVKVQIGVVGDAGAGKSTFINSFRGLSPGDVGAAEVSAYGHATTEPAPYDVPGKELVLVDFPGVLFKPQKEASSHTAHEVDFNIQSYLDRYGEKMQECDFFLIFVTNRLSNNVVWIAKEVHKMGKGALFVRSQVDLDIAKVKHDNPKDMPKIIDGQIAERQMLDRFVKSTKKTLEELDYGKVDDNDIFIISGLKDHVACGHYHMDELRTAMQNRLPTCKQEVLIRNTQDFSVNRVKEKAEVMRKRTWFVAVGAAAVSAAPVPGLGVALDIATVIAAYKYLRRDFNIDDASIDELASICNKSALALKRFRNQNSTLWNAIKNSSGPMALRHLVAATASSITVAGLAITSATAKIALPLIGGIIAAPASFALIVLLVREFIEELEMCATKLFKFAFSKDCGN
ncbi:interferon-inducible GTPase 5-like [Branchiostoma floridae x Branchiostoma belcheri]